MLIHGISDILAWLSAALFGLRVKRAGYLEGYVAQRTLLGTLGMVAMFGGIPMFVGILMLHSGWKIRKKE